MPIFVSYRLLKSLKTCASIGNPPKRIIVPFSRYEITGYSNKFVLNIWLCQKFFVLLHPHIKRGTCVFLSIVFFIMFTLRHGHSWEPPLHHPNNGQIGMRSCNYFKIITMPLATFLSCLCFIWKVLKFYRHGHSWEPPCLFLFPTDSSNL